jgi:hypothetical protein
MSIDASEEIWYRSKRRETKYMLLCRYQDAGQNHDIKIENRSLENVSQFINLGTTVKIEFYSGRN